MKIENWFLLMCIEHCTFCIFLIGFFSATQLMKLCQYTCIGLLKDFFLYSNNRGILKSPVDAFKATKNTHQLIEKKHIFIWKPHLRKKAGHFKKKFN